MEINTNLKNGFDCADWIDANPKVTESKIKQLHFINPEFGSHLCSNPSDSWGDPILFDDIEVPDIPTDLLPETLGEYAESISKSIQTPSGLAVMCALSTAAICLQKRYEVVRSSDHKEPLSLWTATVLPSGTRKSPVLNAVTAPLKEWEIMRADELAEEIRKVETLRAVNSKAIDDLFKKASKVKEEKDKQDLLNKIDILKADTPDEVIPPRLWTGDVTPEELQNLLFVHEERMGLISDEGGMFEIMSGLYTNGRANTDIFLQGYSGTPARIDRGKRSVALSKPAITFCLSIQPEVLTDFQRGGKQKFRGDGTLARFIYCVPKSNVGSRDVTHTYTIPTKIKSDYQSLIFKLLDIQPKLDSNEKNIPRNLTLDKEAMDIWNSFAQFIESNQGKGREFEPIQDWTCKLPGTALRIAGIFHVVEHIDGDLSIGKKTMENACKLCELLIGHAKIAFGLMAIDRKTVQTKAIIAWIIKNGEYIFTLRDCFRDCQTKFTNMEDFNNALPELVERQILRALPKFSKGGRPSIKYEVNPAIFDQSSINS